MGFLFLLSIFRLPSPTPMHSILYIYIHISSPSPFPSTAAAIYIYIYRGDISEPQREPTVARGIIVYARSAAILPLPRRLEQDLGSGDISEPQRGPTVARGNIVYAQSAAISLLPRRLPLNLPQTPPPGSRGPLGRRRHCSKSLVKKSFATAAGQMCRGQCPLNY